MWPIVWRVYHRIDAFPRSAVLLVSLFQPFASHMYVGTVSAMLMPVNADRVAPAGSKPKACDISGHTATQQPVLSSEASLLVLRIETPHDRMRVCDMAGRH